MAKLRGNIRILLNGEEVGTGNVFEAEPLEMPEYGCPGLELKPVCIEVELYPKASVDHITIRHDFGKLEDRAMADTNPRLKTPLRHRPKRGDLGTITEGDPKHKRSKIAVRVTHDVPEDRDSVLVVPAKVESDDSPREVKLDEFTPKNAKAVAGLMAALVGDVGVRARVKGRTSELTPDGSDEEYRRRCRETVKRIAARVKQRDAAIHEIALKCSLSGVASYERAVRDLRRLIDKPTVQIGALFTPTDHQRRYVEAEQRQRDAGKHWSVLADAERERRLDVARELFPEMKSPKSPSFNGAPEPVEESAESEWREFIGQDFEAMGINGSAFGPGGFLLSVRSGHCCYVYEHDFREKGRAMAAEFIEKHRTWRPITRSPVVRVDDDGTREVVDRVESWHWEEKGADFGPWVLHVAYRGGGGAALFITAESDPWRYRHGPDVVRKGRYAIARYVANKAGVHQERQAANDFVNGVFN